MNHKQMLVDAGWDPWLVALSYVVAALASYAALDLAGRVASSGGRARRLWLAGGALAMGVGIWSMHFTGMLAFRMGMPVTYDVPITLLSVVVAVAASGLALVVVARALGLAPAAGGGPDHGRRHSGDALHRDGRDADGGDGQLRPRHRRILGRHRGGRLDRGALPGLQDQPPGRAGR